MPRNISNALKLKMAQDAYSLATIVTITRRDGVVLAFTSWDVSFVYGGITYQPTASLQSRSLKQTATNGTDMLEVQGIIDSVIITDSDLINGKYDGANVLLQEIDPTDLGAGAITLLNGYSGELNVSEGVYIGEVRSKSAKANQQFGDICSNTCRVNQLGDSDCAPGGTFANGATMSNYRQVGTLTARGVAVNSTPVAVAKAINCGGGSVGAFLADTGFSGGSTSATGNAINISYQNSATQTVYQTYRVGQDFTYTVTGLTANQRYNVRLHWAESYFPTAGQVSAASPNSINGIGMRLFNVTINGNILTESYDVTQQAGGKFIAVNHEYKAQASGTGVITINIHCTTFNNNNVVESNAMLCGIEVITLPLGGIINGLEFNSTPNRASGTFTYGTVKFTSGLNTGLSREVKIHYLNGSTTQIGLQESFPYDVAIGDTAILEWGCNRLPTTCRSTFHNFVNFQGEPWVPGNDQLIAVGRPPT